MLAIGFLLEIPMRGSPLKNGLLRQNRICVVFSCYVFSCWSPGGRAVSVCLVGTPAR